jgi:hypothetical protein
VHCFLVSYWGNLGRGEWRRIGSAPLQGLRRRVSTTRNPLPASFVVVSLRKVGRINQVAIKAEDCPKVNSLQGALAFRQVALDKSEGAVKDKNILCHAEAPLALPERLRTKALEISR